MMFDGTRYMAVGTLSDTLLGDLGVECSKEERRALRGKRSGFWQTANDDVERMNEGSSFGSIWCRSTSMKRGRSS
jgi:hypothetical protein